MRLHAIGRDGKPCPWCKAKALNYQYEGGGGDLYRCSGVGGCGRTVIHEYKRHGYPACELKAVHPTGDEAARMECLP